MRPFFHWRDDWMLGCKMLDEQHLELAERMNELHRFLVEKQPLPGQDAEGLNRKLSQMYEETRLHFQEEEALMQAYDYPALADHRREHLLLLAEMQECLREIEEKRRPFTLDNLKALKYWQIDHVLNSDREFAGFLNSRPAPLLNGSTLSLRAD